jgi:hypothetical protein
MSRGSLRSANSSGGRSISDRSGRSTMGVARMLAADAGSLIRGILRAGRHWPIIGIAIVIGAIGCHLKPSGRQHVAFRPPVRRRGLLTDRPPRFARLSASNRASLPPRYPRRQFGATNPNGPETGSPRRAIEPFFATWFMSTEWKRRLLCSSARPGSPQCRAAPAGERSNSVAHSGKWCLRTRGAPWTAPWLAPRKAQPRTFANPSLHRNHQLHTTACRPACSTPSETTTGVRSA